MNKPTALVTAPPPTAPTVTADDVWNLAALAGAVHEDKIDTPVVDEGLERLLHHLFPALQRHQMDRLWDRASVNACALWQLEQLDTWEWPVRDMDPPRCRQEARFDALRGELERAVEADIAEAHAFARSFL